MELFDSYHARTPKAEILDPNDIFLFSPSPPGHGWSKMSLPVHTARFALWPHSWAFTFGPEVGMFSPPHCPLCTVSMDSLLLCGNMELQKSASWFYLQHWFLPNPLPLKSGVCYALKSAVVFCKVWEDHCCIFLPGFNKALMYNITRHITLDYLKEWTQLFLKRLLL